MKAISKNWIGWIAGFALGVAVADTVHDGWAAVVLLGVYMLGRWVLASIASIFFTEELGALKRLVALKDPVKYSIWNHTFSDHVGQWRDCKDASCVLH